MARPEARPRASGSPPARAARATSPEILFVRARGAVIGTVVTRTSVRVPASARDELIQNRLASSVSAASTITKPAIWFCASAMPDLETRLVLPTMTSAATMAAALRLHHSFHAFRPALSIASCSDLGRARRRRRLPASWCRRQRSEAWACSGLDRLRIITGRYPRSEIPVAVIGSTRVGGVQCASGHFLCLRYRVWQSDAFSAIYFRSSSSSIFHATRRRC